MTIRPVTHEMPKKQVMTLRDLEAFVADARKNDATGDEIVFARISWSNGVQKLSTGIDMKS